MRRLILALAALAIWPAAAGASEGRWGLTDAGDPLLSAPRSVADDSLPGWWACPNAAPCGLIAEKARRVEPGPTAVGTVFDVQVSKPFTEPIDERSPLWLGRVTALAPPRLDGVAAVGSTVKPVGARWSGGWGTETSRLMLVGCPGPARNDCQLLGDTPLTRGGWYLYAVDYRSAADRDPAGPIPQIAGPGSPAARPVPSALVAVSEPVGPVAAGKTDPDPNARYKVTLRARVLVDRRDLTVARITCPVRCAVELRVSDGRRTVRRKFNALGTVPVALLDAPRLRAGALQVKVTVDGRRAASGTVRF